MTVIDLGEVRVVREYGEFLQLLKCLELAGSQLAKNCEHIERCKCLPASKFDEENLAIARESNRFFGDVLLTCGSELQGKMGGNARQLMSMLSADCLKAIQDVMAARKCAVEMKVRGQSYDYSILEARAEDAAHIIIMHVLKTHGERICGEACEEQERLMQFTAAACPYWMEFIAPSHRTVYVV